jgi:glycosyltransferase involved in cell wall biosynthesis
MRIGVDAREIVGQATGVGRYLSGLLAEWAASGAAKRHDFILYAHAPMPTAPPQFQTRVLPGTSGTWWQQVTLPSAARADNLDVFFAPQYTSPVFMTTPTVVVIYDVSFAAHPEWFRTREGVRLRTLARQSAYSARAVVTISEFSKREIVEHLRVDARDVHVIPPGIPVRPAPANASRGPRLLYAGSIFNRRHVPDLIRAFGAVARTHPDATLDIVGDNRTYPFEDIAAAIGREERSSNITWHSYASDALLAELYAKARAFAFLSEYEGLGLTPLEALAAGVPSVLYDTAIARESCGAAALYVRQHDRSSLARAIEQIMFDERTRAELMTAASVTSAKYAWPRAARETLELIERCR